MKICMIPAFTELPSQWGRQISKQAITLALECDIVSVVGKH